jgi:hypothetical protein
MGDDQSHWSAPCGRTHSTIAAWRQEHRNNNPPPDIPTSQQSELHRKSSTQEIEVLSTPSVPSTIAAIQIIVTSIVIFGQVFGDNKMQEQQQSCQLHVFSFNIKC